MSPSQYITLEEFTSSPPPSTILLPRSHALRLLELCELAEMSPSRNSNANYFIGVDSSNASNSGSGGVVPNPHVLVTQMALLLYLGEYTHARHLWRRHRKLGVSTPRSTSATTSTSPDNVVNNESGSTTVNDDDYAQLESLWEAAKYCYLWSTGGVFSLTSNSNNNSNMQEVENTNDVMQDDVVQNDSGSAATLPFSTLALRALQSCQSKKIEPLSTYSAELIGVLRSRVNKGLHTSFDKLDCNEFRLRMNIEESCGGDGGGDGEEEKVWESFGWKKEEGGYLVSNVDDVVLDDYDDEVDESGEIDMKGKDRIGKLTDIVMFLEGKMNA